MVLKICDVNAITGATQCLRRRQWKILTHTIIEYLDAILFHRKTAAARHQKPYRRNTLLTTTKYVIIIAHDIDSDVNEPV